MSQHPADMRMGVYCLSGQVRQVGLDPTNGDTINDRIHAVASKLYPLYESLGEQIRSRLYLQIDEVPWRIADTPGKCRKGYAWQFFDATLDSHGPSIITKDLGLAPFRERN